MPLRLFCVLLMVSFAPAVVGPCMGAPLSAAEERLKSADEFFKRKDFGGAGDIYREVFISNKKGPVAERALFGMCRTDYYLKKYSEAVLNIKRLIALYPQSGYLNETYLLLGYIADYLQKYKEALQYFDRVGGALSERASIGKAEVLVKTGDSAGAESLMRGLSIKTLEGNPRAVYLKAELLSRKNMHREAASVISKIPEQALKEENLRVGKALILYHASRFSDAEKICKNIIRESSSSLETHNAKKALAKLYEFTGKTDDSLALYLEIFPHEMDDAIAMSIVKLYDKRGDRGNALRYLTFLKDKQARASEIEKRLKGVIDSKDPRAIEYLIKYSGYLGTDSPFIVEVSKFLTANGKKTEAMVLLRKAQNGMSGGDVALFRSELLVTEGKLDEAKKLLLPIMFDKRYFVRSTYLMAEIFKRQGDYPQAIRQLTNISQFTKDSRVFSKLADLYWETGDRSDALKHYVLASDAGDSVSSVKAADLYYMGGDGKKAEFYYKRALGLGGDNANNLQWVYYQYGKLSGDKGYLRKAAESGGVIGDAAKIIAAGE